MAKFGKPAYDSGMRGGEKPRVREGNPGGNKVAGVPDGAADGTKNNPAGEGGRGAHVGPVVQTAETAGPLTKVAADGTDLAKSGMRGAAEPVANAQETARRVAETPNSEGGQSLEAMAPGLRAEDGGTTDQGERLIHIKVPPAFFGEKKGGVSSR